MPAYVLPVSAPMFADHETGQWLLERTTYDGPADGPDACAANGNLVNEFLFPVEFEAHTVRSTVAQLGRMQVRWRDAVQAGGASLPQAVTGLLELLSERPVLTAGVAATVLGVPEDEAHTALERLLAAKVVAQSTLAPNVEGYFAVDILDLLEEAARPLSETRSLPQGRPLPTGYNYYVHGKALPPPTGFEVPAH